MAKDFFKENMNFEHRENGYSPWFTILSTRRSSASR